MAGAILDTQMHIHTVRVHRYEPLPHTQTHLHTHFKVEPFLMSMVFRDKTSSLHLALGIAAPSLHQNVKPVHFPVSPFSASQ